jgi:hypothetical protein
MMGGRAALGAGTCPPAFGFDRQPNRRRRTMAVCDNCGNDYDKSFQVTMGSQTYTFDSFECAISRLAPECAHCGTRIIGHGLERDGTFFCCNHCAEQRGEHALRDRV